MRRLGIALATTTLLLTACAGEEEPTDPTTGTETTEENSTTDDIGADTGDADSASETAAEEGTGDGADATEAAPDQTTEDGTETTEATEDGAGSTDDGTATEDDAVAGDTGLDRPSEEILAEAGLLEDGAVSLGPAPPQDETVQLAICDYLFGTPEDVASVAGAAPGSEVLLAPGSGHRNMGGSGGGPQCLWTVDGEEAFAAVIWAPEIEDEDDDGSLLASTPLEGSDYFGYVAVNPEWDGRLSLDENGAIDWLEDAGTRWAGASV